MRVVSVSGYNFSVNYAYLNHRNQKNVDVPITPRVVQINFSGADKNLRQIASFTPEIKSK